MHDSDKWGEGGEVGPGDVADGVEVVGEVGAGDSFRGDVPASLDLGEGCRELCGEFVLDVLLLKNMSSVLVYLLVFISVDRCGTCGKLSWRMSYNKKLKIMCCPCHFTIDKCRCVWGFGESNRVRELMGGLCD